MNELNPDGAATNGNGASHHQSGDPFEQLRSVLLAPEQGQIADLQEQLKNPEVQPENVSRALPSAVRLSAKRNDELARALTPVVELALNDSVRRDPTVLRDAIFPIIGPAIRKAITEALAGLLQSLNQTLEHTLSPQSFRWRLEAKRTGKSFAEVVLSRTLVYRVEQVFLIHKETGLLLQHVQRLGGLESNADMVSGMLTAIQDFARDSFGVTREATLETMQLGELNVWVDSSPHVMLAAVIRGVAPQDFRTVLQNAIEQIHRDQGILLEAFTGDPEPFETLRPCLEGCLRMQAAVAAQQRVKKQKKQKSRLGRMVSLTACLALVGWGAAVFYRNHRRDAESRQAIAVEQLRQQAQDARWMAFAQQLRAQEGIVIIEAARRDGKFHVTGLRDPLAADPESLAAESRVNPAQLVMRWEAYYALSPGIILQRATRRLQPPPGVALHLREGVLAAEGSATADWIFTARRTAESIPGVSRFDDHALRVEPTNGSGTTAR